MKKMFTFIFVAVMGLSNLTAQTDAEITANWQFPIDWWFPNAAMPEGGVASYARSTAFAKVTDSFDPVAGSFDEAWASAGKGNVIGSTPAHILGLAESNNGADDFKDAAFKVLYDASNMYILLQWTDDDVTGSESIELCLSPYFRLDVAEDAKWYARFNQFGANKLAFKKTGFDAAMMVNFDADGKGSINWGGTTETLTDNLFLDDKTEAGSKTVKWVVTIGYAALTGEFRPEFNVDIWKALNDGKGISFDMKVNDVDTDDALTGDPAAQKPAEYWWSSRTNDAWQSNMFVGFINANEVDPTVVFDPATYAGALDTKYMTIVDIDGTKYLQVVVNGWNSTINVPEVTVLGTQVSGNVLYTQCTSTVADGYTMDKISSVVQLMDTVHKVPADWDPKQMIPAATGLIQNPTTPGWSVRTADIRKEMTLVHQIQFFGQEKVSWGPVVGDTMWVGKITMLEVGISSKAAVSNLSVYPNPANDKITLDMANLASVEIYNLLGAKVAELQMKNNEVNISNLNSGVYVVKATDTKGKVAVTKFHKK
jgi:hypothetical protein